jgi:hypothetical protein
MRLASGPRLPHSAARMAADYILRMIQQAAMMLASIIARKERGDLPGAAREIEEKCLQTVGLPLAVIKQSTPDSLAELLAAGGALRPARSIALAELLIQDAELCERQGDPVLAVLAYAHAARLLADSLGALSGEDFTHYQSKLEDVDAKLRDLDDGALRG